MDERQLKALMIAATSKLTFKDGKWFVPSQSSTKKYAVDLNPKSLNCDCPDFELRGQKCKHILATEIVISRETRSETVMDGETVTTTMTEIVRVKYTQQWSAYNEAQTREKDLFQKFLHDLCSGIVEPPQEPGRPGRPRLSLKDMLFAVNFKVFSTYSGRRFMSDLREAKNRGYIERTPHFNSVFNYLELEALTPVLRDLITYSSLPLKSLESNFAVDSSGFSTSTYARWFSAKYGKEVDFHKWLKVHLMCGVKTNVVTAVEITDHLSNDSPQLPALVGKTAENFDLQEVTADKGYSSRENHDAIARTSATPYIAFKKNTTGGVGGLFETMYKTFCADREAFLEKYHQRSNVESTFSMIKAKFGTKLRSKGDTAQTNEALCKVLCHNICCLIQSMFEFGIEIDFRPAPLP